MNKASTTGVSVGGGHSQLGRSNMSCDDISADRCNKKKSISSIECKQSVSGLNIKSET